LTYILKRGYIERTNQRGITMTKLEQPKKKYPITLTIKDVETPFVVTTQEGPGGFIEITDLVLKGSTDLHALSLLLDATLNNQAIEQIENLYKEDK